MSLNGHVAYGGNTIGKNHTVLRLFSRRCTAILTMGRMAEKIWLRKMSGSESFVAGLGSQVETGCVVRSAAATTRTSGATTSVLG